MRTFILFVTVIMGMTGTACTAVRYAGPTTAFESGVWGPAEAIELARVDVSHRRLEVVAQNGGCVQESRTNPRTGLVETALVTGADGFCGAPWGAAGMGAYGPTAGVYPGMAPYVQAAQQEMWLRSGDASVRGGGLPAVDLTSTVSELREDVNALGREHRPAPGAKAKKAPAK